MSAWTFSEGHLYQGKVNLKDLLPRELEAFFASLGEPAYRARQVIRWLYVRRVDDIDQMTDLSKALRARLKEVAVVPSLRVRQVLQSRQETSKFLFELADGSVVESVCMRYLEHLGPGRLAACISTQVGCAMACDFCASGKLGLYRHLSTWEIVDQVTQIQKHLDASGARVANVVYMGIGEPLHNYENTLRSVRLLAHGDGLGIGMRHLAISTSGLVPQIRRLAAEKLPLKLAISLHATDDATRTRLMPVNKRWGLQELLAACRDYQAATGRRLTFEYVMLDGVNDSVQDARRLVELLRGIRALVNVIPWNPIEGVPFGRSRSAAVRAFQETLEAAGVRCTVRQEKGTDINAACGQLRLQETVRRRRLLGADAASA
ncbi:MAG TPA: 23S rRNA (adenine(2503)-C(2))-methyltransferase RlmN [Candidatus Nitrosotenuis sp.]|nr:23S rRNA (adenine(2503)-C(2))-methyltransferase RlmN [Candidatus Nitrosotenuis sp.]